MGRIVANAVAISEWYSRIGGSIESCGQTSVAMGLHVLKGTPATTEFVTQISQYTVDNHQTVDYPRASTSPDNLIWLYKQYGVAVVNHSGDWEATLRAYAGVQPLVFGVGRAYAFGGHNSNIDGHYICAFGFDDNGDIITGDPNSSEATQNQTITYTIQQYRDAAPFCCLLPTNVAVVGSLPFIGGAANSSAAMINQTVRHAPGFLGMCETVHDDEQIEAPNIQTLTDVAPYLYNIGLAVTIRGFCLVVGTVIILAVMIQMIQQFDPGFSMLMNALPGAGQAAGGAAVNTGASAAAGSAEGAAAVTGASAADLTAVAAI